jgi:tetratricopeptide (TPR) repeat protein
VYWDCAGVDLLNNNVHSLLSLLYLIQGGHEKAVEEGRKAIALGPSDSEAHLLFEEVLYQSGNFVILLSLCII